MSHPFSSHDLYVSPDGNDQWTGRLATANASRTDGPLATLAKARDLVRERKAQGRLAGPLTVWLRGGRYHVAEPVVFGPEDSAPVTYAAYPGEHPILDAGIAIQNWHTEQRNGVTVWATDVTRRVRNHGPFRQLFVNGQRRQRARLPKHGYYWMEDVPGLDTKADFVQVLFSGTDTFRAAPGDIHPWRNLNDVDVVVLHYWIEEHLPIAGYDEATRTVKLAEKSVFGLKDDLMERYAKYYVENAVEALAEPGEWALDRQERKVYYVPLPGEDMATAEIVTPGVPQCLKLVGQPEQDRYVEFLRFVGLTFCHTDWTGPINCAQAAFKVPGVIYLEGARHCSIEDCTIEHIGWYGIELADGCTGIRIVGNTIADMGAGGIKVSGATAAATPDGGAVAGPVATRPTSHNHITDNHIHGGGRVFHSAVGVLVRHASDNIIAHNHIHDLFYTGISCGWVWGYAPSVTRNNRIEKNHIHDIGQGLLSDMGGIYTLGVQPGTVIRGNLIHDVAKANYGGWAIYPDEGSSHIVIENNVCYHTTSQCFHQHYGGENIIRNNLFAFGREGMLSLTRGTQHAGGKASCAFTFERNIVITDGQPVFVGSIRHEQARVESRNFLSDLNLFWDVAGRGIVSGNGAHHQPGIEHLEKAYDFAAWQALGHDRHSIVADPKCRDLSGRDFALAADSPAFALGFQPIDLSDVGPRPKDQRDG